ncbi:hypothetical protein SCHPADRAFT_626055 [Schizopora paradoxa]|uniref:Uncharacterized protein n=1 Tax=Schizopora paradoxa TaxID=27342 RepID=A0A0H2RT43_9AGAM|nr:hypothetical protein SCHPADRAFT_626055 [Schizopora paradoxa]
MHLGTGNTTFRLRRHDGRRRVPKLAHGLGSSTMDCVAKCARHDNVRSRHGSSRRASFRRECRSQYCWRASTSLPPTTSTSPRRSVSLCPSFLWYSVLRSWITSQPRVEHPCRLLCKMGQHEDNLPLTTTSVSRSSQGGKQPSTYLWYGMRTPLSLSHSGVL